jgi:sirohydrochlorin cobaltochelatase
VVAVVLATRDPHERHREVPRLSPDAVIVFAHGARDPEWARPIERLAALIGERLPGVRVRCAYLELMQPDLATAVGVLVAEGARRIRIVPAFLAAGGHVKRDLPQAVERLRRAHDGVALELRPPIGESDAALAAIAAVFAA